MPYTLRPGADAQAIADVLDSIEREAADAGLAPATVDRVVLVAGELLSNAVEHGDVGASVRWHSDGRLEVEGQGGPWRSTLQHAALPSTEVTRGRGLFLIRSLADGVAVGTRSLTATFIQRSDE